MGRIPYIKYQEVGGRMEQVRRTCHLSPNQLNTLLLLTRQCNNNSRVPLCCRHCSSSRSVSHITALGMAHISAPYYQHITHKGKQIQSSFSYLFAFYTFISLLLLSRLNNTAKNTSFLSSQLIICALFSQNSLSKHTNLVSLQGSFWMMRHRN